MRLAGARGPVLRASSPLGGPALQTVSVHAQPSAMVKRLEQVVALVVAAGLAIVSYWLFFSWMGGDRRPRRSALEAAPGLEQPLLGFGIVDGAEVGLHLIAAHGKSPAFAQAADAGDGA